METPRTVCSRPGELLPDQAERTSAHPHQRHPALSHRMHLPCRGSHSCAPGMLLSPTYMDNLILAIPQSRMQEAQNTRFCRSNCQWNFMDQIRLV